MCTIVQVIVEIFVVIIIIIIIDNKNKFLQHLHIFSPVTLCFANH